MAIISTTDNFFVLARKAYERSLDDSSEAVVALILSAMGVEAFVNDLTEYTSNPDFLTNAPDEIKLLGDLLSELEEQKAQVGIKIQIAYFILKRQKLKIGELPYQDFALLINIRNALVHKKPEKLDLSSYEPHKFVKRLAERKVVTLPAKVEPSSWYVFIEKPEVALWSYKVAIQMLEFLVDLFPASMLKGLLTYLVQQINEIPTAPNNSFNRSAS